MIVLEPWGLRATFFGIVDDVDAGELLQIAADDTSVVTKLINESANRAEVTGIETEKMFYTTSATPTATILNLHPGRGRTQPQYGPLLSTARRRGKRRLSACDKNLS